MEEKRLVWFKGKIVPVSDAKINVLAPTSQFGANVFEGIRCYWNDKKKQLYAFRLKDHMKRLIESSDLIGFKSPYSQEELERHFISVIKANNYREDIAVRQTLFLDGFGSWSSVEPVEMFIAPILKKRNNNNTGLTCCISSWERINEKSMSPKIKCGANYINSRMAQLEALKNGFDTAIFLNNKGTVSEGPGSCIFIVKDKELITPPLTASILDSITRNTLIQIGREHLNLRVNEKDITPKDLKEADEVFLCGSAMEITLINKIDNKIINNGNQGEITQTLQKLYFQIVEAKVDKYKNWLTPIYTE